MVTKSTFGDEKNIDECCFKSLFYLTHNIYYTRWFVEKID